MKISETNRNYCESKEGRKEMFYLTMHSTHFLFTVIWHQTYGKELVLLSDRKVRAEDMLCITLARFTKFREAFNIASASCVNLCKGRKEVFYLMTHSTHFIYGYMASDIW